MALSGETLEMSLRIVHKLVRKGVTGANHKQPQSVAGWFATHERGEVKRVIDAMVTDTDVPLRQKGRGTIQLTSIPAGEEYLQEHDRDPPESW